MRPLYLLIIFLLAIAFISFNKFTRSAERTAEVMGTTLRVKILDEDAEPFVKEAISEIKRLDKLFSRFDEGSEVSRINSAAGKAPVRVSSDTYKVIEMAVKVSRLSRGAFDIALGHSQDLKLDKSSSRVYLREAGEKVDLGGIGKGYAVESARWLLLKQGVKSAIIDMHSSIAVIGNNWRIGIQDPRNQGKILGVVILNDGDALSTSAQYEQPGHILDPRTGKAADKCLSVTVVARDAGLADALSTAVFVLGPADGMKLIKSLKNVKVIIVDTKEIIYDNFGFKLR